MSWQRTSFKRRDGTVGVAPDDWTLHDDAGRPLRATGGRERRTLGRGGELLTASSIAVANSPAASLHKQILALGRARRQSA
jgi:hypothetical protein